MKKKISLSISDADNSYLEIVRKAMQVTKAEAVSRIIGVYKVLKGDSNGK